MSETKEPWEVEQIERKNTTKMNKVENTPVKWISKGKNTILTKQEDGLKRATSQCLRNKIKNGMEWTKGNKILKEHAYNKC